MKTKFSLQKKLIVSFIVFLFFPLLFIGLLIHQSYYQFFLQKEIALSSQKIGEASANLDDYLWQVNQLAVDIALSPSIQDILMHFNPNHFIGTRVETRFFQDLFGVNRMDNCKIQYIKVSVPDGQIGLSVGTTSIEPDTMDKVFTDSKMKSMWCVPRDVNSFSGKTVSVISLYQQITSSYNQSLLGLVRIDIPTSYFQLLISGINYLSDSTLILADQKGTIITYAGTDFSPALLEMIQSSIQYPSTNNANISNEKKDNNYIIYGKALSNGWRVLCITPSTAIEQQAFSIKQYVFVIGGCGALFTLILYVLISFSITNPLRSLMEAIDNVKSGSLDTVSNIQTLDEFGIISDNFNQMTAHIKNLIKRNTEIQRQETISELLYLQSQIEPHFLYNTLDSIRFNARREGALDVCNQLEMLSNLFRYYLATEGEYVTFYDEFNHIENYLSIQKLRYKERLSYTISYDPQLQNLYTIRLILQPIVENSIIHGLDPKIDNGHLIVSGILSDELIIITISDDGVGFDQEQVINQLNDQDNSHIFALKNIDVRLKLHFGQPYGIDIKSQLGKGTKITLTLPVIQDYPEGDHI